MIKIAYCLNLAALIIFFCFVIWQFVQSSLVDLPRVTLSLGMLAFFCYRLVKILHNPIALDAFVPNRMIKTLRALAIFLMWVGVLAMVGFIFKGLITSVLFYGSTEPGFGLLPVVIYLGMAGILGIAGVFLFEAARFMGRITSRARNGTPETIST